MKTFTPVFLVIVGVIASILSLKFLGPIPLSVTQTTTAKQSTFDVTGESELVTVPDEAKVTIGVTTQASTVAAAQSDLNQRINQISGGIKNLGISDKEISTTNYSINPNYDYSEGRQRIIGYEASSQLRITIKDLQLVNQVIDTSTANEANQVHGITFGLSSDKEAELKMKAREQAIEDAKRNAKELAELSGMKLGKIVNVYESHNQPQPPIMYERTMAADALDQAKSTQIEPGSATYTYQITLSYETL